MAIEHTTEPIRTARRERGSITPEAIVSGALRLAGESGIDALSMPKLARSLGIGVTSIYWHFQNKDALIEAMIEEEARRLYALVSPTHCKTWQDYVYALFNRLSVILQRDDLLCDLLFMRGSRLSETALLHLWPQLEEGLRLMVEGGFTPVEALQNHAILSLHMRGTIVLARHIRHAGSAAAAPRPVPDSLPFLAEVSRHHNIKGVSESEYLSHLRQMIAGMEALLEKKRNGSGPAA